ncbi:universal stress protein [Streptomyces sp. NPDC086080]|uniref:universal stress protein n=1 Tax=Streptomyces sp. NPDC086080 TaxID=3365748 RepID=UPI0037D67C59
MARTPPRESVITVGLDGSPESLAAARWAAAEAERRDLGLRLLHAWPVVGPERAGGPSDTDESYWAKRMLRDARAEILARHPRLAVVGDLVEEEAPKALLHAASESEMIVLGSQGMDPVERFFLGDISMFVAARAERPVVLVRAVTDLAAPPAPPDEGGDVVVALKLHGPCDDLLGFAFATAAARGVAVRAVHGRSLPVNAYVPWGVDHDVAENIRQDTERELGRVLRPWREAFQGVEVVDSIGLVSPAKAVVGVARTAGLLVVGRRRQRRALAPRLGPVAHAALHHAHCPVAVVPHD